MAHRVRRCFLLVVLTAALLALTACGEDEEGSATMRPGEACLACHTDGGEAPAFAFAGTVFTTAGSQTGAAGVTVKVVDGGSTTVEVTTNSAGNFSSRAPLTAPLTLTLTSPGGATATMGLAAAHGDCNLCHASGGVVGSPLVAP
ncbi:MAG: hypothetical protein GW783_09370 [Deltaproteobacteria bacterium]|nr:hypothetical protein [Deltaproteobacteria bacterium]NCS74318.1 hypothetical protein [Deltaproteobacteria bacterium]PIU80099.1 MAG: hypothetical protein COS73_01015 [Nitrospirae bacterium CG06_land_8_20_14_3_00_70_43]PIW82040.1 MAG: hypothetical protein COZ96_10800 [Nitrospirae bacterium CG_4_8_14_3_um_filter_70_85]